MRYTDTVAYETARIGQEADTLALEPLWVPRPFPNSPLWSRMHQVFDPEHFLYAAPPVDLGHVPMDTTALGTRRVLRCPLKVAGDRQVYLPVELRPVLPLVRHVLETELACNPDYASAWMHISVERTQVERNCTQRVPGWHVDGFQGVRTARHRIEHSYLWSDVAPTQFCLQPFFVQHLDPARHNVFAELERQAQEVNAWEALANHVMLIDPYLVHRAAPMPQAGWRTFVRVTVADAYLADPVNTVNLGLPWPQEAPSRLEVRNRLYAYEGTTPYELSGLRRASER